MQNKDINFTKIPKEKDDTNRMVKAQNLKNNRLSMQAIRITIW